MSHSARCDNCGQTGQRRMKTFAPDGWLYLEATDEDDPENTVIMLACSKECAAAQWKVGPGRLPL